MDDLSTEPPTDIDPYQVFRLEATASTAEVKTAYKKLALRYHPDKAQPDARDAAHTKFQEIAFAYAILSDERRRKRYDATGNTSESLDVEDDDFNWADFFRAQWADAVTESSVNNFKSKYQNSDEEKADVLAAFKKSGGDLNKVFEMVMLSNPLDDEDRFRGYIDAAIKAQLVTPFVTYVEESEKKKKARQAKAKKEAKEAEEHAASMNKEKSKAGGKKTKKDSEADLLDMIQNRNKGRSANFLDDLEAKYGGGKKGANGQNGKKRKMEEPPEEAFQKTGLRGKKKKANIVKEEDDEDEDEEDYEQDHDLKDHSELGDEDDDEEGYGTKGKKPVPKAKGGQRQSTRQRGRTRP